ncbi:DUF544 family protein, putative [Babesia ovis]|uniref:DUF544 family protein, putative n=1 Tax=Babesia ovis TaxID=5869 RepID=A0A9W5TDZ9_BABOV|nr:DUF544 family protein, putative [Babesia ovis]
MSADSNKSYRVKWLRHFSRVTPFLQYTDAKDSLLISVANVLFLRRKIQLNQGTATLSFNELSGLVVPLVKRVDSKWVLETLLKMEQGTKVTCPLNSIMLTIDEDIMKLMTLLSINVFHACVVGTRYKNIENFTYDELRYHLMLHERGQQMEGVRFEEPEATAAEAFLAKYTNRVTEKGLQMIKAEFRSQENAFHTVYHQNRFQTLTYNDENLYVLMADVIYQPHGCFWEQLDKQVYLNDRFKPYTLEPNQVKVITPAGTPRGSEQDDGRPVVKPIEKRVTQPKVEVATSGRSSLAKALDKRVSLEKPDTTENTGTEGSCEVKPPESDTKMCDAPNDGEQPATVIRIEQPQETTEPTQAEITIKKMIPEAETEPVKPRVPPEEVPAISLSIERPDEDEPPKPSRRTNEFIQAGSTNVLNKDGKRKGSGCGCQRFRFRDFLDCLRGR